jgi:uncharacterized protein (DUF1330 family)
MAAYFIVTVRIGNVNNREQYDAYIEKVKPIAESFGGKYLVRSEMITALSDNWNPDRVIIIKFDSKEQITKWLSSPQYHEIAHLRINSVESEAIIVEQF